MYTENYFYQKDLQTSSPINIKFENGHIKLNDLIKINISSPNKKFFINTIYNMSPISKVDNKEIINNIKQEKKFKIKNNYQELDNSSTFKINKNFLEIESTVKSEIDNHLKILLEINEPIIRINKEAKDDGYIYTIIFSNNAMVVRTNLPECIKFENRIEFIAEIENNKKIGVYLKINIYNDIENIIDKSIKQMEVNQSKLLMKYNNKQSNKAIFYFSSSHLTRSQLQEVGFDQAITEKYSSDLNYFESIGYDDYDHIYLYDYFNQISKWFISKDQEIETLIKTIIKKKNYQEIHFLGSGKGGFGALYNYLQISEYVASCILYDPDLKPSKIYQDNLKQLGITDIDLLKKAEDFIDDYDIQKEKIKIMTSSTSSEYYNQVKFSQTFKDNINLIIE